MEIEASLGSSFGRLFRITTFGESHGPALGVIIDGCPPGLALAEDDLARDLARRRPGQSLLTSQRREEDRARILSGVHEGKTTGTPIALVIENEDARPQDYDEIALAYRPSHADFTYDAKYGTRDPAGGGRASARETAARVAAGAVARKLLRERVGVDCVAWVERVQKIEATVDPSVVTAASVEANPVRCPDGLAAARMAALIEEARREGDSLGGVVACVARGVPPGWGDPVFDKLEADLAKALLSLPASKGFEIGSGFQGTFLKGSEHNDPFRPGDAKGHEATTAKPVRAPTNRAGGVLGGISSGEPIFVRVAFKPTATIRKPQETVDQKGDPVTLAAKGRHDPCVLPRAVPIVEAMVLLVLADHWLRQEAQCGPAARGLERPSGDARLGR
jgi:chorismate synthase